MEIAPFGVEEWMNEYELDAEYNIAETCVESITVKELLKISGSPQEKIEELMAMKLTYGDILGSPDFRQEVAALFEKMEAENILATHGAIGANFLVLYSLVRPEDRVVSVLPTYQQLYSIPQSFGAEVKTLKLRYENGFLPDLDELRSLVNDETKVICINNPNNPSGALMEKDVLEEIVEIARSVDAYILADEVYRGLYYEKDKQVPSIVDIYEKGISVGSMSKVFSLAGLRMGWIAASKEVIAECQKRRDYNTISVGMIDDFMSVIALKNKDKIMARNLNIIREQLDILDDWVKKEPSISYVKPRAGTTAFLKYDLDIPSEEFCKRLFEEKGVLLVPGSNFEMDGYVRIGYAGNLEELKTGLTKVSEFIKEIK